MSCPSEKVQHPNRKEALKSARKVNYRMYGGFHWVDVYLCPSCTKWHLTSKPQPRRSKKKRR
jgi:hypothetical protein